LTARHRQPWSTARRLEAEGVVLLIAVREQEGIGFSAAQDLPLLSLTGLDRVSSEALLHQGSAGLIAPSVGDLLFRATRGNPLALVELPTLLPKAQLMGMEPLDEPLPTGPALERAFSGRIKALPDLAQKALRVASMSESGSVAEIAAALGALGLETAAFEPAEQAGLIVAKEDEFRFRHPLVRSAAYWGASVPERRHIHRAFATALDNERVADRRVWHMAAAAIGPDEEVAATLEQVAMDAHDRGASAASAAAFERAARLTADNERRAQCLLEAAKDFHLHGHSERALELLNEARNATDDPLFRADVQRALARILTWSGSVMDAHNLLWTEAQRLQHADPARAVAMAVEAVGPSLMAGEVSIGLQTAVRAREMATRVGGADEMFADLALGTARLLSGDSAAAHPVMVAGEDRMHEDDLATLGHVQYFGVGSSLIWLEEFDRARRLIDRGIARARAISAPGLLPYALAVLSELDFRVGNWTGSHANAAESLRLAEDTGQRSELGFSLVYLARVEAGLGLANDCKEHTVRAGEIERRLGVGCLRTYIGSVLGFLQLGAGDPETAICELQPVAPFVQQKGLGNPSVVQWAPDLIEAYVRGGRTKDAWRALYILERQAAHTGDLGAGRGPVMGSAGARGAQR
jgi:tetratricopeptide (TPR) repeat protein